MSSRLIDASSLLLALMSSTAWSEMHETEECHLDRCLSHSGERSFLSFVQLGFADELAAITLPFKSKECQWVHARAS